MREFSTNLSETSPENVTTCLSFTDFPKQVQILNPAAHSSQRMRFSEEQAVPQVKICSMCLKKNKGTNQGYSHPNHVAESSSYINLQSYDPNLSFHLHIFPCLQSAGLQVIKYMFIRCSPISEILPESPDHRFQISHADCEIPQDSTL